MTSSGVSEGTDLKSRIEWAEKNLQRQLEWIGRHDTRSSFITGICLAMLGVLVTVVPEHLRTSTFVCVGSTITVLGLAGVLVCIYLGQYPRTESPNASLLFFGMIAGMKADEFQKRFKSFSRESYLDDILAQTHINAFIVSKKFGKLKIALILLLLSSAPWAVTIFASKWLSLG